MKYERGTTTAQWGKGLNNRTLPHNLPDETVLNAVNIDFGAPNQLTARLGMSKVLAAVNPRGGHSCPLGCFFVESGSLKTFNTDNTSTSIYSGLSGTTFAFDYLSATETLYFSDGITNLKITSDAVVQWGMTPPAAFLLSTSGGSYGGGVYQAVCCWVDSYGVESGASPVSSVAAGDNSGLVFSYLPTTTDPQVAKLRLYMTAANGSTFFRIADIVPGSASYSVLSGRFDSTNICDGSFLVSPPPPGRIIRHFDGRIYVADAFGAVWYSNPFEYDRFNIADNYMQFTASVDVMQPVKSGIFFAYGNRTDFYLAKSSINATDGAEEGFHIEKKFDYGAVFGTGRDVPNSDSVVWQSQRGTIIGTADGQAKNIQEANVGVDAAVTGAVLVREENGMQQFIASLQDTTASSLAAKSWITAEITRRGE